MPKVSARFRNRKINFRTRIAIHTGTLDTPSDNEADEFGPENDQRQSNGAPADRRNTVETGVDKEEESELHLQQVINASTAALLRSAVNEHKPASPGVIGELVDTAANSSSAVATQLNDSTQSSIVPHIPIPDAAGLADPAAYQALYAHSKIFLPSSYIRFSDTVEDTLGGVLYTMDEEDESWLNWFNTENSSSFDPVGKTSSALDENGKNRRSNSRKGKEKERTSTELEGLGRLGEDDFEAIMDHFEKTTEETVPGLHLDTSRLPSLADFELSFDSLSISQRLPSVKIFAKFVYSHWKERRLKRGGKPIMPAIDFDETNENNPYVCFRRREIKMVRKTRRTDAQNMDRLIRLRNDLYKAQELLNTVLSRERIKREAVELEKAIFEGRCLIREMKRNLNEAEGDEELLVSKREKRRKREQSGNGTIKSPTRNAGAAHPSGAATGGMSLIEDVQFYRDQARASTKLMERDYNRCREEQNGWEDLTDSAHLPMTLSAAALRWRSAYSADSNPSFKSNRESAANFDPSLSTAPSVMEHNQFRKRVGRGGRIFLDRIIAPRQRRHSSNRLSSEFSSQTEEDERNRRLTDRWRYDDDLHLDFPCVDYPHIIDDYSIPYSTKRMNLLDLDDLECLDPQGEMYLRKVAEYFDRAPEQEPPVVKVGKLPGKVIPNVFGTGTTRQNLPASGSVAPAPEQVLSAQASAQVPSLRMNNNPPAKRVMSGAAGPMMNKVTTPAQVISRIRKNVSSNNLCGTNGSSPTNCNSTKSSPHGQQSIHQMAALGWQTSSKLSPAPLNLTDATSGNGLTLGIGTNSVASLQQGQVGNPISSSYPSTNNVGGLSRSIPVPANSSPANRVK